MIILELFLAFLVGLVGHLLGDPLVSNNITSRIVWDRMTRYGIGYGMIIMAYTIARRKSPTLREEVTTLTALSLPLGGGVFTGYLLTKWLGE